jgi:hypothetical protein
MKGPTATGTERAAESAINVDGYRERVAGAVGMALDELISSNRADPRANLLQMVAAYLLRDGGGLPVSEIARVMDKDESWVRSATDYIERRVYHYYAFKVHVEQTMATYALASMALGKPGKVSASGVDIDGYRERIAHAAGMTAKKLVAFNSDDQDAETMQKVVTYVLLSRDLLVGDVALIVNRDEQWIRSSKTYIQQRIKRDPNLKVCVESTIAMYLASS